MTKDRSSKKKKTWSQQRSRFTSLTELICGMIVGVAKEEMMKEGWIALLVNEDE